MTNLLEDPTYLAGAFAPVGWGFLGRIQRHAARQIPDSRRDSLWVALLVVAVEWFWVTDNERIEQVVYDLRRAVLNSDVEGARPHGAERPVSARGYRTFGRRDEGPDPGQPEACTFRVRSDQRLADQCWPAIAARESRISGFQPGAFQSSG